MKRFLSLILSALLMLSLATAAWADWEGEPQRCIDLSLECSPSTGYSWTASSSDEAVAFIQELGITTQEEDIHLVGAPAAAGFRICGEAAGTAEITFAYARSWEDEAPTVSFTVSVTVDDNPAMTCIVRCNFDDGVAESGDCTISNSDVTMGVKGETFQISLRDANGNKITGLLWVSSDLSICSVDGTGVVKAEGSGTAYVSTTYNGISYQCIVRCNLH